MQQMISTQSWKELVPELSNIVLLQHLTEDKWKVGDWTEMENVTS